MGLIHAAAVRAIKRKDNRIEWDPIGILGRPPKTGHVQEGNVTGLNIGTSHYPVIRKRESAKKVIREMILIHEKTLAARHAIRQRLRAVATRAIQQRGPLDAVATGRIFEVRQVEVTEPEF